MTADLANDVRVPDAIAASLVDPSAYASWRILDSYRWLRENMPLAVAEPEGFDPFWVVTKHADILHVSRNNDLFPSGERATTLGNKAHIARSIEITGTPNLARTLIQMDGRDHRKYRGLTQAWFAASSVRRREETIVALSVATVARFERLGGSCDFVKDIALEYPLRVVMDILGVPDHEFPRMLRLTQELFGPQDPDNIRAGAPTTSSQYTAGVQAAVRDFNTFFSGISADRRANPRDDLATLIAMAEIDGAPIGEREATSYYMIVASAGHDTTSYSISTAMWALATVPGLLETLKDGPELIPQFVEEAIRWASPVKTFMRSASEDTELRGQKIRKGDWLALCYASGNRDEEIFDRAEEFDITRKPNAQLAFGFGAHSCLGQHLARSEMRHLFGALVPRLKNVELAGEAKTVQSWFVNGLKSLPIRYELA